MLVPLAWENCVLVELEEVITKSLTTPAPAPPQAVLVPFARVEKPQSGSALFIANCWVGVCGAQEMGALLRRKLDLTTVCWVVSVLSTCRKHQDSKKEEEKKKPHIKKPLNAFMLYMKEMRAKVVAECTLKESAAINQILGRRVGGSLTGTQWTRVRRVG